MLPDFRSRLESLRRSSKFDAPDLAALARHLQVLNAAPEPRLAAGRQRVLAEAARMECPQARGERFKIPGPSLSFALAAAFFLVTSGALVAAAIAWSSPVRGNSIVTLSTSTVAYTPRPVLQASETFGPTPAATIPAAARDTGVRLTASPGREPAPAIVPEPTVMLIEPGQPQPSP